MKLFGFQVVNNIAVKIKMSSDKIIMKVKENGNVENFQNIFKKTCFFCKNL